MARALVRRCWLRGTPANSAALVAVLLLLVANPILRLVWDSFHTAEGQWSLQSYGGEETGVAITPRLKSEDMATLKAAALQGLGLVALPAYTCRQELDDGRQGR